MNINDLMYRTGVRIAKLEFAGGKPTAESNELRLEALHFMCRAADGVEAQALLLDLRSGLRWSE